MINTNNMEITKDLANKKITITRHFDASPEQVWSAWTQAELLDLWWAPKPWKTETTAMDFKPGGYWLYSMVGPNAERHYCKVDYETVEENKRMTAVDYFCDENGQPNDGMPKTHWTCEFSADATGTAMLIGLSFDKTEDLETLVQMGFEQGFTSALENLDALFATGHV